MSSRDFPKCGHTNLTRDCDIKERIDNPFCINCEARGHTASWGECPKYPKQPKNSRQNVMISKRNLVEKNIPFAHAVKAKTQVEQHNNILQSETSAQTDARSQQGLILPT
ncbi:hypothetical protein NPIL_566401 [Nephila pilipes]|uniref:Uncharacterized protein n=1 Tax=Nephila pilipes TaxID=299642 RepID=A0A8X6IIV9_NEPPI|nr:hypothetical protein NPIL_566401 [Nephila pilipes]